MRDCSVYGPVVVRLAMRSSSDNLAYPGKEETAPARHALRIRAPRATARSADPHSSRPRRLVELGVRAWTVAADVLLASLGFVVFIWGDLTTHRGVRVGGIVLVTLAFVAGAIISTFRGHER